MKKTETLKKYIGMNEKELNSELKKIQKNCTLISLSVKAEKEKNVAMIKKDKKNIARIKSVINNKFLKE